MESLLFLVIILILFLTKHFVHALRIRILLVHDVRAQIEVEMLIIVQLLVLNLSHLRVNNLVEVVSLKLHINLCLLLLITISLLIIFILINIKCVLSLLNFVNLHLRLSNRHLELLSWLRIFLGDSINRLLNRFDRLL